MSISNLGGAPEASALYLSAWDVAVDACSKPLTCDACSSRPPCACALKGSHPAVNGPRAQLRRQLLCVPGRDSGGDGVLEVLQVLRPRQAKAAVRGGGREPVAESQVGGLERGNGLGGR